MTTMVAFRYPVIISMCTLFGRKSISGVDVSPKPTVSSVLCCPVCHKEFQERGKMQPLSLICGHSFCAGKCAVYHSVYRSFYLFITVYIDCIQKGSTRLDSGSMKVCCSICNKESSSTTKHDLFFPNYAMVQVISAGVVPKCRHLCDMHQHEKNYYCIDDKVLVCIYCAYDGDHSQHKCQHVDTAKQQMDNDLHTYKKQILNEISEIERNIRLRTDEQKLLQSQQSSIEKAVNDFYSELSSTLMKQKRLLLDEIATRTENMNTAVEQSIK